MTISHNPRTPETEVDAMFPDRWSPRSFRPDPLADHELMALFEAARWAPSCNNEQPAFFVYARTEGDRARFASALSNGNRVWASTAPVLLFICTRTTFAATGTSNRHAWFDAGAAWMSLALQARRLGLYCHCMAGFNRETAQQILGLPADTVDVVAAIAVGRLGRAALLPSDMAVREKPSNRRALSAVFMESAYTRDGTTP